MTGGGVETTAHDTNIDYSAGGCAGILDIKPLSDVLGSVGDASPQEPYIPVHEAATGVKDNYE